VPKRTSFLATLCFATFSAFPSKGTAQTLDQVETFLKAGQLEQARAELKRWKDQDVTPAHSKEAQLRATYLNARLATSASEAYDGYLEVALSGALSSPYAAESHLRIGQMSLSDGDAKSAVDYLQRLIDNYPRSEHTPMGRVFLARAQLKTGNARAACATVTDALQASVADSMTVQLLRHERTAACNRIAADTTVTSKPVAPAPVTATPARLAAQPPKSGAFALQVGAFREKSGAQSVLRQLQKGGFENTRLVTVPDNTLIRVRVGKFASSADAAATAAKLRAAGFSAVIVSDAAHEAIVR
jgi:cell division septation protein DedD